MSSLTCLLREVVLERGLLTAAELDDIFSAQNLMHPAYKAKRSPAGQ
jgi:aspartate ammonia-lyase